MSTELELSAADARSLTERIKTGVEVIWDLVKEAYRCRAWSVLGYDSWDDYCTREFGTSRIKLPREDRHEVVSSMREIGMSTRAIATATGTSKGTVDRVLSTAPNGAVGGVTGVNGKTYSPSRSDRPRATAMPQSDLDALNEGADSTRTPEPESDDDPPEWEHIAQLPDQAVRQMQDQKPRRSPITDDANRIGWEVRRTTEKLDRLTEDDRWGQNTEKVTPLLRGHLQEAISTYTRILAELEGK